MAKTLNRNVFMTNAIIPHSKPTLGREEAEAVAEVVRSGMVAQGEKVREFENAFSLKFGFEQSAAVSSGTAGLHLALLALEIGPGDEVIIPSFVCTALLNAVHHAGANPVIADIDPATFNIDPQDAIRRITRKTRAIMVPHMFGLPADLDPLLGTGVPVIEDCAQSLGATYQGKPVGRWGAIAVYSFYATKMMTTGEGGMVAGPGNLIEKIKELRDYDNRPDYRVRFNYKLTDVQASMGLVQLRRLDPFIAQRRLLAGLYADALGAESKGIITLPQDRPGGIYFRFIVRIDSGADALIREMKARGIACERPVHTPLHRYLGLDGYMCSEAALATSISLPIYPGLQADDVSHIANIIIKKVRVLR
jgi:perosamine synthetase